MRRSSSTVTVGIGDVLVMIAAAQVPISQLAHESSGQANSLATRRQADIEEQLRELKARAKQ
jgi:hypothetical protein